MLRSYLNKLEDPEMPLLAENYWLLKKSGLILPENSVQKLFYLITHQIVLLFVISQYIELYVIRSDLDLVLLNMKISMISIVCIFKVSTFVFWQKEWRELFEYVTAADIFERQNADEDRNNIIKKYTRYCKNVNFYYWCLIVLTLITNDLQPIVIYYLNSEIDDGMNATYTFPHIMSAWTPYDRNLFPASYITVVYQILFSIYGAMVMASYDTIVVVILVFFEGKLDLLRDRCQKLLGTASKDVDADEFEKNVRLIHGIHVTFLKCSKTFNSVLSPVMFFYMLNCTLVLCCTAYQITSTDTSAVHKLLIIEYLLFGITQLFLYCWHSNDVLFKSIRMTDAPAESKWWKASANQMKVVQLLSGQFTIKNEYTAGPFTPLTLATFITILKGAYSYYTLLRD